MTQAAGSFLRASTPKGTLLHPLEHVNEDQVRGWLSPLLPGVEWELVVLGAAVVENPRSRGQASRDRLAVLAAVDLLSACAVGSR